jgi:hypothetical protein
MVGSSDDPVAPRGRSAHAHRLVSEAGLRGVGKATVRIDPVGIGPDNQPRIDHVTETRRFDVRDCNANGTTLSPPNVPWRMEITVSPTFIPKDIDPTKSESRRLGAVIVKAGFQPLFG